MVEISVVIPVYNVEEYLGECLDSITNQTFEDIEIICINNGSTDNSLKVLREYEKIDSRIKVISHETRGLSRARNTGVKMARGKYIYFIDSDDYLELYGLEKIHNIAVEKNLDLLMFKLVNFDKRTGYEDYNYSDMPFLLDLDKDVFNYRDFKENILNVDVSTCTKLFKRELIKDKRFAEEYIFEDNLFNIDYLFDAKRIYFLDECLYHRRIRNNSITTRASKDYVDIIEIFNRIYKKFKENGIYPEFKEKLFMRRVDAVYYRFTLIKDEYKEYYFEKMKQSFFELKEEYENNFDLDIIEDYHKNLFTAVLESETPQEFVKRFRLNQLKTKRNKFEKKNKKLKKELKKIKRENEKKSSSITSKIKGYLGKLFKRGK